MYLFIHDRSVPKKLSSLLPTYPLFILPINPNPGTVPYGATEKIRILFLEYGISILIIVEQSTILDIYVSVYERESVYINLFYF